MEALCLTRKKVSAKVRSRSSSPAGSRTLALTPVGRWGVVKADALGVPLDESILRRIADLPYNSRCAISAAGGRSQHLTKTPISFNQGPFLRGSSLSSCKGSVTFVVRPSHEMSMGRRPSSAPDGMTSREVMAEQLSIADDNWQDIRRQQKKFLLARQERQNYERSFPAHWDLRRIRSDTTVGFVAAQVATMKKIDDSSIDRLSTPGTSIMDSHKTSIELLSTPTTSIMETDATWSYHVSEGAGHAASVLDRYWDGLQEESAPGSDAASLLD